MAISKKVSHENLRQKYLDLLIEFLSTKKDENGENDGEEILRIASNAIAFPVVDENGDDRFDDRPRPAEGGPAVGADEVGLRHLQRLFMIVDMFVIDFR